MVWSSLWSVYEQEHISLRLFYTANVKAFSSVVSVSSYLVVTQYSRFLIAQISIYVHHYLFPWQPTFRDRQKRACAFYFVQRIHFGSQEDGLRLKKGLFELCVCCLCARNLHFRRTVFCPEDRGRMFCRNDGTSVQNYLIISQYTFISTFSNLAFPGNDK